MIKDSEELDKILEEFDDKVDEWHNSSLAQLSDIHEHLGLTIDEYISYVCYPKEFAKQYANKKEIVWVTKKI